MRVGSTAGLVSILLLTLSGPALAQSEVPAEEAEVTDPAFDAYNRAREAYRDGDFDRALDLLRQAARQDEKPVYVYNMARVLEAMGRHADAHASFQRARALPGMEPELDALAKSALERLEPIKAKAVVKFDPPEGTLVQLDEQVLVDTSKQQVRESGSHQICITDADGAAMRCWVRSLEAGITTTWPPKASGATRGAITLPEGEPLDSMELDGFRLVADLTRLRSVAVDIGAHVVKSKAPGGLVYVHQLDVLPGRPATFPRVGGVLEAGQLVEEPMGPWPWIIGGTGIAALIVGGTLLGVAPAHRKNETSDAVGGLGFQVSDKFRQTEHLQAWEESRRMEKGGYAMVGIGGAALIGGLTWLLASAYGGDDAPAESALDFHVVPTQSGLLVGGGF